MNLEGLTLHLLTQELTKELLGSKIYKIFMPNNHSLLLLLKRDNTTTSLLADLSGGSPALYIPHRQPENPEVPPTFCMLLRKHLEEGRITAISQLDLDRIITLEISLLGRGAKLITKKLIFELAGKNSNIILTEEEQIIDSLRHIGPSQSSYRLVLPARPYVAPPPQQGLNILTTAPAHLVKAAVSTPAATFSKALISATTGIGQATAMQLLHRAQIPPQEVGLTYADQEALVKALTGLQQRHKQEVPVYALISPTNRVKTILTMEPLELEQGYSFKEFASLNAAINFALSLQPLQLPQQEVLSRTVAAETAKLTKKLQALEKDLQQAHNADDQRIIGDTLMANLYLLQKGQSKANLINIYDGEEITVTLSPLLTPAENAQAYYKHYNKYKRAQKEVQGQLEATKEQLNYLASLEASLMTAATKNEFEEIRQEMLAADLLKEPGKKKKASLPKSQPLHIKLDQEADLYIGRNNKQNDHVTFTIAGPRDLWFHTKDIPGSHVVLKANEPKEEHISLAVKLAAYFSKARQGSNVPVDCVQRRYVKKPSGSKPGFVIFTNQTTYYTTPKEQELAKYLK